MDVFVARQPILKVSGEIFAYELLFRSSLENAYPGGDRDFASIRTVMDSLMTLGLDALTRGRLAFINFTRRTLLDGCATLLPSDRVVIEILEDVKVDPEVLEVCKDLKRRGYRIALDDFVLHGSGLPLLSLADFVKIDFLETTQADRQAMAQQLLFLQDRGLQLVAEKVESREHYLQALDLKFSYLQGYYFSRPDVVSGRGIPSDKLTYTRLLREVHRPEYDLKRMEALIKGDLSLSYNLLRFVNSAAFGLSRRIHSIHQALVLLGQDRTRRMVSLVAMSKMAGDKPSELVVTSIVRASFCQGLGDRLGLRSRREDLFLMGMFSLIDAVLDQPLEEALALLPLSQEIKDALLGRSGFLKQLLDLAVSYEQGSWDRVSRLMPEVGVSEADVPELYRNAVQWVDNMRIVEKGEGRAAR